MLTCSSAGVCFCVCVHWVNSTSITHLHRHASPQGQHNNTHTHTTLALTRTPRLPLQCISSPLMPTRTTQHSASLPRDCGSCEAVWVEVTGHPRDTRPPEYLPGHATLTRDASTPHTRPQCREEPRNQGHYPGLTWKWTPSSPSRMSSL